jgi:transposase InsO family protein
MATFWVVNERELLWRVDQPRPGMSIDTADGTVAVEAIGTALVYLKGATEWECYQVPNVLLLPRCPDILYSTRVMRDLFGFKHDLDTGVISPPGANDINVADDGSSFSINVAFVPSGMSPPRSVHKPRRSPMALSVTDHGAVVPEGAREAVGTSQATLYQRLGCPYTEQWRLVPSSTSGHGLPPDARVATDIPVRDAVVRGRSRALPFVRPPPNAPQPPPGAVFYMDFAGPLLPSHPHRFTVYCGVVDAGSGYSRVFPGHGPTTELATSSLSEFIADVGAKLGFQTAYKPYVVRSDQGSAFVSSSFHEFLTDRQIQQSLACVYTPKQNSHIERTWGIVFGTARVILAAANLPPSIHPFALHTSTWITNRLPRPSRGHRSPFEMLTRELPDLSYLYSFGCLCKLTIPSTRREGDRHFADRGEMGIYMGPSEQSPGSVVFMPRSSRIVVVAKIQVWEDQFPGLTGHRYDWFPTAGRPTAQTEPEAPAVASIYPLYDLRRGYSRS